jgi:hypothetical protein
MPLSTTNHTWTALGANLGLCGVNLVTKCLSHGMATIFERSNTEIAELQFSILLEDVGLHF